MTAFVKRRELLRGFAELPVASHIAVAETYPSRPLRILVATSAGGGTDRLNAPPDCVAKLGQ
jgi:tripartite-type tricarboxylate transporter receptor subunit TctC